MNSLAFQGFRETVGVLEQGLQEEHCHNFFDLPSHDLEEDFERATGLRGFRRASS
jgi:hypothetical protein